MMQDSPGLIVDFVVRTSGQESNESDVAFGQTARVRQLAFCLGLSAVSRFVDRPSPNHQPIVMKP